jgi:DNA-binding NarL/FixJ family response regulator
MITPSLPSVVVADDDERVRDALASLIGAHPGLDLVGCAESGFEAAELCEQFQPTVAVVDVMMPGGGDGAIVMISGVSPRTAVLVYTARSDRRTRERMLDAGAVAVIVKGGGRDLCSAILDAAMVGAAPHGEVTGGE